MILNGNVWITYPSMDPKTVVWQAKLEPGFKPYLAEAEHDQPATRPPSEFYSHAEFTLRPLCEDCVVYEKQASVYRREIDSLERVLQRQAKETEATNRREAR